MVQLGYEDLNDHEQLRHDPLLAVMAGRSDTGLSVSRQEHPEPRLELSAKKPDRYKKVVCNTEAVDRLLVDVFLEAYAKPPEQIVVDLDATDFAIHGRQEGRFFHGFYDEYCYLPLYVFCDHHLLGCTTTAIQHRWIGWSVGRSEADCGTDSPKLANGTDHFESRFRFLSRWADGLVRRP